jgi:hypothetical protein
MWVRKRENLYESLVINAGRFTDPFEMPRVRCKMCRRVSETEGSIMHVISEQYCWLMFRKNFQKKERINTMNEKDFNRIQRKIQKVRKKIHLLKQEEYQLIKELQAICEHPKERVSRNGSGSDVCNKCGKSIAWHPQSYPSPGAII